MNTSWNGNKTQNLLCLLYTLLYEALMFDPHGSIKEALGECVSLHFTDKKIEHQGVIGIPFWL